MYATDVTNASDDNLCGQPNTRYLANQQTDALFSFGWGLSYTRFEYSELSTSKTVVTVTVTNTGTSAGAEVVQLYLGINPAGGAPNLPFVKHALHGFEKTAVLSAGASATVTFPLRTEQLTVVDAAGRRIPAIGSVLVSVAGHLPSDPRATLADNAKHASNVVSGSFLM
jgi:beta-glucosidase